MSTENKEVDYLSMSDEEIANMSPEVLEQSPLVEEVAPVLLGEVEVPVVVPVEEEDEQKDPAATNAVKGKTEPTDKGNKESNPDPKEPVVPEVKPDEPVEVDYKAQLDRLLTPFKANGRDIAVKNVDDAISLMQMGANYNKKMAALKPNLKLMKMLENNGLLSEEKIGFLIDLEKKNPEAINKLVKDSGLDPLDLNADKAGDYTPNTYAVDDREMELDAVLDELQSTPSYNQTLNIVSNKWDGASKQVIANSPQLLKVINSHVQSGIYDLISKEIESERVFGRLNGLSDIEAYRQVGDAIQARGGFNQVAQQPAEIAPTPVIVTPKPKQEDDDKLREKKRAASSSKPAAAAPAKEEYNPLALSDDAFSKLINDKYL